MRTNHINDTVILYHSPKSVVSYTVCIRIYNSYYEYFETIPISCKPKNKSSIHIQYSCIGKIVYVYLTSTHVVYIVQCFWTFSSYALFKTPLKWTPKVFVGCSCSILSASVSQFSYIDTQIQIVRAWNKTSHDWTTVNSCLPSRIPRNPKCIFPG